MNYVVKHRDLTSVADSIRDKGGTVDKLAFPDGYVEAIENLPIGGLPEPTSDGVALIGVNGEWRQQEGYGYIGGKIITWDGDTTGKVVVETVSLDYFCKVTDYVFSLEELIGCVEFDSDGYTAEITYDMINNIGIGYHCEGVVTVHDAGEFDGAVFPESGTYFYYNSDWYTARFSNIAGRVTINPNLLPDGANLLDENGDLQVPHNVYVGASDGYEGLPLSFIPDALLDDCIVVGITSYPYKNYADFGYFPEPIMEPFYEDQLDGVYVIFRSDDPSWESVVEDIKNGLDPNIVFIESGKAPQSWNDFVNSCLSFDVSVEGEVYPYSGYLDAYTNSYNESSAEIGLFDYIFGSHCVLQINPYLWDMYDSLASSIATYPYEDFTVENINSYYAGDISFTHTIPSLGLGTTDYPYEDERPRFLTAGYPEGYTPAMLDADGNLYLSGNVMVECDPYTSDDGTWLGGGGGGEDVLVVRFYGYGEEVDCDLTPEEVFDAANQGRIVIGYYYSHVASFNSISLGFEFNTSIAGQKYNFIAPSDDGSTWRLSLLPSGTMPEPTEDGTALISVNGRWTRQTGYGYRENGLLEWDGSTEECAVIEVPEWDVNFYKVSDDIFTREELIGGYLDDPYSGSIEITNIEIVEPSTTSGFCLMINGSILTCTAGTHLFYDVYLEVPEDGTYFIKYAYGGYVSGLETIGTGDSYVTIDPNLLPAGGGNTLVVHFTEEEGEIVCDTDPEDILSAAENGTLVFGEHEGIIYDLFYFSLDELRFGRVSIENVEFRASLSTLFYGRGFIYSFYENEWFPDGCFLTIPVPYEGGRILTSVGDGANTVWQPLPNIPSVIDNVTSTSTTDALSAKQGKLLNDRIDNVSTRGRFLSLWDCTTGLPLTNPSGYPYQYHTGDFFIVNKTGATNYIPNGSSYQGTPSTTVYSGAIKINDTIFYDGTTWSVFDTPSGSGSVQDVYQNGSSVLSSGIAYVTTPTELSDLTDDATHRLVTDTEKSTWNGKQNALTAGANIQISGNTISATDTTYTPATSSTDIASTSSAGTSTNYARQDHVHGIPAAINAYEGQGYGTCTTMASTAAKTVTLANYTLQTGGIVSVRFTYAVPANATLNINSKGAKSIYYRNAAITANVIGAGDTATFIYDGTRYHLIAIDDAGGLPSVTTSDNGKVLMVQNGAWAAANLPTYNGGVQ